MKSRRFTGWTCLFLAGLGVVGCVDNSGTLSDASPAQLEKLEIWWEEGFYPEETDTLRQLISQWEKESSFRVDLRVIPQKDILADLENALEAGTQPDIFYSGSGDLTVIPRLAWSNQLADVTDVILPLQIEYSENALAGVNYQNRETGKRSYYAVPLMQSAIHIHFWDDILINKVGERRDTIPKDWQSFWDFWSRAHGQLKQSSQPNQYGLGMPMSLSLDTYNNFEQFLESFNAEILDSAGQLNLDNPNTKEALTQSLASYSSFFQNQEVSASAVDWDNTGNNVSLLSRESLMTVNHTLSAPGSQRNNSETYFRKLSTIKWPSKPDGSDMRFVVELKQAVILGDSDKIDSAKSFLKFLAQPNNLLAYTKGAQGRYLPVMPALLEDSFWQDPKDPHISVAVEQLQNTRPAYQVFNPAYGEVAAQNVWGNVIRKMAVEKISAEEAASQAIAQIEQIFSEWQ